MNTLPAIPADALPASGEGSVSEIGAIGSKPRTCPECGEDFHPPAKGPGQHKRFCSSTCRVAWANREKAEGSVLVTVAKAWRRTRGSGPLGSAAFKEMTSILDILLTRDQRAGRPGITQKGEGPLRPYLDDLLRDPYMDREQPQRRINRRSAA